MSNTTGTAQKCNNKFTAHVLQHCDIRKNRDGKQTANDGLCRARPERRTRATTRHDLLWLQTHDYNGAKNVAIPKGADPTMTVTAAQSQSAILSKRSNQ